MPKPTKVRILEYLYTVSSIPRKQLKLAFQDVAYNTVFRATKELLDSGYIELLSVSKGPTRIKITKAGIYNIGMNLSNGKLGVNSYSIDTVDVTNEVHKWLADHGYTRVE